MSAFDNKKECKLVPGKGLFRGARAPEGRTTYSQSYGKACSTGLVYPFLNRRGFVRHSLIVVREFNNHGLL